MARDADVFLTKDELNSFLAKEVGLGTDGRVMHYSKDRLIKLYHKYLDNYKFEANDDDMKIYHKGDYRKMTSFYDMFCFYKTEDEEEYTRIHNGASAIKLAQERQQRVKNTRLPKNAVYVDGRFAGCILATVKGIQIHKLMGLPFSLKRKIMKKVLSNVKELMDNYIYHIDLDNSPYTTKAIRKENGEFKHVGHSHILVNPITLKPEIIDLDGKSTVYADAHSDKFERESLMSLNKLVIEFLLGIDLDEYENCDELSYTLSQIGIDIEYIDLLTNYSMNYEQLDKFIDDTKSVRRI